MSKPSPIVSAIVGAAGGAVAIALMVLMSERSGIPLQFVPFATSIVLVMGSPEQEPAQPRALVCGHLLSTVVGLALVAYAGPSPWAAAGAVGLAMVAMHGTRSFHPPAGIDALIAVYYDKPWDFFLAPVAVGRRASGRLCVCLAQRLPARVLAQALVVNITGSCGADLKTGAVVPSSIRGTCWVPAPAQ